MRKLLYLIFTIVFAVNLQAQQVIDGFDSEPADTNYWMIMNGEKAQGDIFDITYVNSPKYAGEGAIKVDYRTSGYFSWGNHVGAEQWCPDSTGYYDLSGYDSLTFRYYVEKPADSDVKMILRLCLIDVSDVSTGAKTYTQAGCEKYFSFLDILKDAKPGWNYVSIPLVSNDNLEGKGFAQRTWGGMSWGNNKLDLDMIKAFIWEFVCDEQTTKIGEGTIYFDQLELHGAQSKAMTFFNGKAIPSNITFSQGRAGSCVVSDEETSNPVTHSYSLKWTTPGQWDGPIWQLNKTVNLFEQWAMDTLKFKIKAPAGIGDLRLIFQDNDLDSTDKQDYPFEAAYILKADDMNYDNTWKTIQIPLRNFDKNAGVWDDLTSAQVDGVFDTTKIWRFKIFRTNDSRWQNQVVYLDEIWTGSPVFDVMPPEACAVIQGAAAGSYNNLVLWEDVPFEEGEVYDIYCSMEPITDITSKNVDHIGYDVAEGTQSLEHPIIAPLTDQNVTYYYAVVCTDAAGNVGPVTTSAATENIAKGVPIIKETAPANFAVDGSLSEWSAVTPFTVSKAKGTTHIPDGYGYVLDNDADFSFDAYLAVDENNLYVAIDVDDDILYEDETNDLVYSYLYDGVDMFLGLYDWRGESHTSYELGAETDYHFRFNKWGVILDQNDGIVVLDNSSSDFKFVEKFPSGYIMEAKIPFESIATKLGAGYTFKPTAGMRIPIDFIGNDNDATEPDKTRECVLTYSAKSNDESYAKVSVWTHTWIGTSWTDIKESEQAESLVTDYKLEQNYPNPFNPSTSISYSVKSQGRVALKVFDVLGREITTLVNETKAAGNYKVQFNATNLPSGIYFCQMISGNYTNTIKMMMLK
jgi:hypothetical protein